MAAALNQFISRSANRCRPFFQLLKKMKGYEWGPEQEEAFKDLKKYLGSPPLLSKPEKNERLILYLAMSKNAISAALLRMEDMEQKPVYFVSETLLDTHTPDTSL
ncbi:hypothetical protein Vadar_012063 [Vaccinium darrowii]|uniref:Uncharacterized protein n=1 Tax=Vaccinium darrowii TaxID=229202 RepID=A0ACB7ZJG9_9ERIC|nr:hypothetical protein Vadar_012063 [Vaccinium darrowii]